MFVAERPFSATASRRSLMDFEEARLRRRRNGKCCCCRGSSVRQWNVPRVKQRREPAKEREREGETEREGEGGGGGEKLD